MENNLISLLLPVYHSFCRYNVYKLKNSVFDPNVYFNDARKTKYR